MYSVDTDEKCDARREVANSPRKVTSVYIEPRNNYFARDGASRAARLLDEQWG